MELEAIGERARLETQQGITRISKEEIKAKCQLKQRKNRGEGNLRYWFPKRFHVVDEIER